MNCCHLLRGHVTFRSLTAPCLELVGLLSAAPRRHICGSPTSMESRASIRRRCPVPYAQFDNGNPSVNEGMTAGDRRDGKFTFVMGAFITAAGNDLAVSMYQIGRGTAGERGFGRAMAGLTCRLRGDQERYDCPLRVRSATASQGSAENGAHPRNRTDGCGRLLVVRSARMPSAVF
jgi:hypothetical protein